MVTLKKILISFFIDNPYLYYITRCHQMPERSFFIENRQFQICARCTGIIIGIIFGIILSPIFLFLMNSYLLIFFIISTTLLISIDGITQLYKLRVSNNILRLITGVLWGISYIMILIVIIKYLFQVLH
jgi:uncharacterized membrane protein